ncbi:MULTISPECIES: hypothetical protein [unclassified Sphingomonas]|uniref:hypothetical protein n=1 Tax=unclassified Sphingomonas TaxID=196159 RepID=UPI001405570E|nr:hypothetical protein [Sphingomonas sp. AAP5]
MTGAIVSVFVPMSDPEWCAPNRDDEPGWCWIIFTLEVGFVVLSLAVFASLIA